MLRLLPLLAALAVLAGGCASTHMAQYVGKDIRDVIIDSGPPIYDMEMAPGVRAYQFRLGGGTFIMPQTTTMSGTATSFGGVTHYNSTAYTGGGGVIHSDGCVVTYIAEWDETRDTWIVVDYRYPKAALC